MELFTKQYSLTSAGGYVSEAWEAVIIVEIPGSAQIVAFGRSRNDALDALAYECFRAAGALHDAAEEAISGKE